MERRVNIRGEVMEDKGCFIRSVPRIPLGAFSVLLRASSDEGSSALPGIRRVTFSREMQCPVFKQKRGGGQRALPAPAIAKSLQLQIIDMRKWHYLGAACFDPPHPQMSVSMLNTELCASSPENPVP